MSFTTTITYDDDAAILHCTGDMWQEDEFQSCVAKVDEAVERGAKRVILDAANITAITELTIGLLHCITSEYSVDFSIRHLDDAHLNVIAFFFSNADTNEDEARQLAIQHFNITTK